MHSENMKLIPTVEHGDTAQEEEECAEANRDKHPRPMTASSDRPGHPVKLVIVLDDFVSIVRSYTVTEPVSTAASTSSDSYEPIGRSYTRTRLDTSAAETAA